MAQADVRPEPVFKAPYRTDGPAKVVPLFRNR